MPPAYRSELEPAEAASFADQPWWDVFQRRDLRGLIDEALANNYDLRTAVYRVEEAQHQVGVTRSPLFPQASYQGAAQRGKSFLAGDRQPDLQQLPRHLQPGLGDRRLGPHPPRHRGVEGRPARHRRLPPRRRAVAGQRRGAGVLRAPGARPRARDRAPHDRVVHRDRGTVHAPLRGRRRLDAVGRARQGGAARRTAADDPAARAADRVTRRTRSASCSAARRGRSRASRC